MTAIDNIVNINITQSAASVPTVSTTIPLILGTTNPGWEDGDFVHAFGSADELLQDGFTDTSPEYLAALAMTTQTTVPNEFLVARRSGGATPGKVQIDRISVEDVAGSHVYRFTYDGQIYSYTSAANDSAQLILQGLLASITASVTSSSQFSAELTENNSFLVLTGKAEGGAHALTAVDDKLQGENVQEPEVAEADELTTEDLNNIQAQNDSWYALVLTSGTSDDEILAASSWILSRRKRLFANTATPEVEVSTDTTNVAVKLNNLRNNRVVLTHAVQGDKTELVSSWVGSELPKLPGTNNWCFRTLAGQAADQFNTQKLLTMVGNPVNGTKGRAINVYTNVGGVPITQMGTNIDGSYIDVGIGIDWLFFNLQSAVYQTLVGNQKIAYTDAGVALLVAAVRSVLDTGVANGLIDGAQGLKISVAKVADVAKKDKMARRAPTIYFSCVLQGAVNAVSINGTIAS